MLATVGAISREWARADDTDFKIHSSSPEDEGEVAPQQKSSASASKKTVKSKRTGEYGKYRFEFSDLCARIEADGRKPLFFRLLTPLAERDPKCDDCKPLFSLMAAACRPKGWVAAPKSTPRKRSSSSDSTSSEAESPAESIETTTTPLPTPVPARVPSILVDDSVVSLARLLAADEAQVEQTLKAIDKLSDALLSKEGKSLAEQEYATTFEAFMQSAFAGIRSRLAAKAKVDSKTEEEAETPPVGKGTEGIF